MVNCLDDGVTVWRKEGCCCGLVLIIHWHWVSVQPVSLNYFHLTRMELYYHMLQIKNWRKCYCEINYLSKNSCIKLPIMGPIMLGLWTICAFYLDQYYDHSSKSLLPYPGGKSSMAAFEQVVLIVRSGGCSCRLFHMYGKAMSAADPHSARDISVSKMFWKVRKGRQISQTWIKETSLPKYLVVCACVHMHGCVFFILYIYIYI